MDTGQNVMSEFDLMYSSSLNWIQPQWHITKTIFEKKITISKIFISCTKWVASWEAAT